MYFTDSKMLSTVRYVIILCITKKGENAANQNCRMHPDFRNVKI